MTPPPPYLDGYLAPRQLPDGRWAAVQERLYNSILLVGIKPTFYDRHW